MSSLVLLMLTLMGVQEDERVSESLARYKEQRQQQQADRAKELFVYANRRLITLQTVRLPRYQTIGAFTEGDKTIILVVKIVKPCQSHDAPCSPLTWRMQQNDHIVQYEIHNCRCDRKEAIARSKAKQQKRRNDAVREAERDKRDRKMWERTVRKQKREANLRRELQRDRYDCQRRRYRYCTYRCCSSWSGR